MHKEEGESLLEKSTNAEMESNEIMIENTNSNLINGDHIDCVDTTTNETCVDSDSSSSGEHEAIVDEWVCLQIWLIKKNYYFVIISTLKETD